MSEAKVRGYRVALSEERVQLVLKLSDSDALPTDTDLRRLADLQSALDAFQAVLDGDAPGDAYQHRNLK
jgi:hypothetical protein